MKLIGINYNETSINSKKAENISFIFYHHNVTKLAINSKSTNKPLSN